MSDLNSSSTIQIRKDDESSSLLYSLSILESSVSKRSFAGLTSDLFRETLLRGSSQICLVS